MKKSERHALGTADNAAKVGKAGKTKSADTVYSVERARSVVNPVVHGTFPRLCDRLGAECYPQAVRNLARWFERMEEGSLEDDRTPIYNDTSRSTVVDHFNKEVMSNARAVFQVNRFSPKFADAWQEVEKGERGDIGPMSMFLPYSLDGPKKLGAVMSDKPPSKNVNWEALRSSLDFIANLLPAHSVHRSPFDEAITGLGGNPKFALDVKTNSCFPTYKREWYGYGSTGTRDPEREEFDRYVKAYIHDKALGWYNDASRVPYDEIIPYIVGTVSQRTTQKGPSPLKPNDKGVLKSKRLVIAVEKPETWAGKTIMSVLQAALANVRNPSSHVRYIPAWQPQPVLDKNMQVFLDYAAKARRAVISGDISSFDATLPPWLMWEAAKAMATWMDKDTATLFKAIQYADIYRMGVLSPSGLTEPCPSSVKSGSIFTSLNGCICNLLIIMYGHYAGYYSVEQVCVMGDDFIVDGPGLTSETISLPFADFGMECNPSKQFVYPKMLHFLRRLHVLGAPGGQGSVYRVLGSVLSVEDDTQLNYDERNKYAYAFQALARLENANFNPEFETLVHYVEKGDYELHLGKDLPPIAITQGAGDYAVRRLQAALNKPWELTGSGVPFERWAVNGVLRGKTLPPPSIDRYETIYGKSYNSVAL